MSQRKVLAAALAFAALAFLATAAIGLVRTRRVDALALAIAACMAIGATYTYLRANG